MKISKLFRSSPSASRGRTQNKNRRLGNRRRTSLRLEELETRTMLTVGGPVILGGDDLTDHGSVQITTAPGNGVTVSESEVNDSSGAADAIVVGNDYSGAVTPSGDGDFISFPLAAGEAITLTRTATTMSSSLLTLFGTDGTTVLSSTTSTSLAFTAPAAGTYFASIAGGPGSVPLPGTGTTVPETETNNSSGTANAVVVGDNYSGTITPIGDKDYVSFTVGSGDAIRVTRALSTLSSSRINIYGTDGTTVLATTTSTSADFTAPTAGTYFASLEGTGAVAQPGTGNTIVETEVNNTSAAADAVVVGDDYSGAITTVGDFDYVSFSADAGDAVRVTRSLGTLGSSRMTIFGTDGTTVQTTTTGTTANFTAPTTGVYFVAIEGTGSFPQPGTGNTVAESEVNDTSATADALIVGDDFTGNITPSGDADYVAFTVANAGDAVRFVRTLGTLSAARLTIYNADGTSQLATSTGTTVNFTAPAPGTYYLAVQGEGAADLPGSGNTVAEAEPNNSAATANAAVIGDNYTGTISIGNDEDYIAIPLVAGQQVGLETTLGTLSNSTLTLYDTDGTTQLAFDDNSGPGLGSRINFTAPASGTYFLKVRSSTETGTGTYTLTLRNRSTPTGTYSFTSRALATATGTYTMSVREIGTATGTYSMSVRELGTATGNYTLQLRDTTQTLIDGWLYIRRALENIAPSVTRPANDGSVAVLGSTDATATSANAGAAYHFAVPQAAQSTALSGIVRYYDGAAAINQFFADLAAGTVNPAIVVAAGAGSTNDLDAAEGTALTNNATAIANFVNSGGGLLSHGDEPTVSYGWLFALLPGLTAQFTGSSGDLSLTPAGQAAFPGVTNADINAGPWHNHFEPYSALGGLTVLATSSNVDDVNGQPAVVIIGGAAVSLPGSVQLAPAGTHMVGQSHTVTATVTDGNPPAPVVGALVTFSIVAGPNTGVTGSGTTDSSGQASFTYTGSAGAGTDTVVATFVDSLGNTQTSNGVDVDWLAVPEVRGFKWDDQDGDGLWDVGEPGLNGWTIELVQNGQVIATTVTGDDPSTAQTEVGAYAFPSLSAGSYTVREVAQSGWTQTFPAAAGQHSVVLADGQVLVGAFGVAEAPNFGNHLDVQLPAEIHGFKWNDFDGDGVWDSGEPGLNGWTIELLQNGQVIATTTTGDDPATAPIEVGAFGFTGLSAGSYTVREVLQAGWEQTFPTAPAAHLVVPTTGPIAHHEGHADHTVAVHQINLASGQILAGTFGTAQSPSFGNRLIPGDAVIRGYKWNDLDGDGVWDEVEPALSGWTIQLLRDGQVVAETVTGDDPTTPKVETGIYRFGGLTAGSYTVREVVQNGWHQTFPSSSAGHSLTLADHQVISGRVGGSRVPNFGNQVNTSGVKAIVRLASGIATSAGTLPVSNSSKQTTGNAISSAAQVVVPQVVAGSPAKGNIAAVSNKLSNSAELLSNEKSEKKNLQLAINPSVAALPAAAVDLLMRELGQKR